MNCQTILYRVEHCIFNDKKFKWIAKLINEYKIYTHFNFVLTENDVYKTSLTNVYYENLKK